MNTYRSIKTRNIVFSILCAVFLFSNLKAFYSSFIVYGLEGFWIGAVHLTIVYAAFMGVFYIAVSPLLKPFYLIAIGSLLSCNSCYYALILQSVKLIPDGYPPLPAHGALYLLPLLFWIVYLLFKAKRNAFRQVSFRSIILNYPFFVIAAVYLLLLPLYSRNMLFVYIIFSNYWILIMLSTAQLYKSGVILKSIRERRMWRWI